MAGDNKLPPPLSGFGQDDPRRRRAATEAFGERLASLDFDAPDSVLDEAPPRPVEKTRQLETPRAKAPPPQPPPQPPEPKIDLQPVGPALELARDEDESARAHLEPVPDTAHPPQNRRMPTQPGLQVGVPESVIEDDDTQEHAKTASYPSVTNGQIPLPPPPKVGGPSPSPTPMRRGLFSSDRPTNLLAGAAIGVLLTIYPAKKLAEKFEQEQVRPLIADLEGAIDHPLGVQAGLVEKPSSIVARIEDGRGKVRRRFMMIWLLAGLPIGLGLGMIPRE